MFSTIRGPSTEPANLDEIRALVRRITRSSSFAKSERLSSLLTHICDQTLLGKAKSISEQSIGTSVFGRSPDYDSSVDGIVRTQASRLRKQLDLYFRDEGAEEPIVIVIPRGAYVPYFEPRLPVRALTISVPLGEQPVTPPQTFTSPEPVEPLISLEVPKEGAKKNHLLWLLPSIILLVAASFFYLKYRGPQFLSLRDKSTNLLWTRLFNSDEKTLVIVGDSGLVMWHGANVQPLNLTDYMHGAYRDDRSAKLAANMLSPGDLSNRRYTSVVDLEIVHALDQIAMRRNSNANVRFARDVHPNDLKGTNVIVLGASEANPWVEMYDPHLNFYFSNDRVHQVMSVVNRNPRAGEPRQWDSAKLDAQHNVYGVVSFIPNIDGGGNALLLEGTSMAGTESSWDFISNEEQFQDFIKKTGMTNSRLPHFEAVLGTNNFDGSAAKITVLAWRRLD